MPRARRCRSPTTNFRRGTGAVRRTVIHLYGFSQDALRRQRARSRPAAEDGRTRQRARTRDRRALRRAARRQDGRVPRTAGQRRDRSTSCCPRRSPSSAKPANACWGCATSTSRSWAARRCTKATSPRCAPAKARRSSRRSPVYLNALTGTGVHVVTVNDYLAKRDAEWMGPLYTALGLTVGIIQHDLDSAAAPRSLQLRHHLRHQQRSRLRLPARQHGLEPRPDGAAQTALRDRRRGRLDPHRRGAHAADHQRSGPRRDRTVRVSSPRSFRGWSRTKISPSTRKSHAVPITENGRREGREDARRLQPLRSAQPRADASAQRRAQGLASLPQGPAVHRQGRRGRHRRRVHRPPDVRPPLLRRHPSSDRSQGRPHSSAARTRRSRRSRSRIISGSTRSSPG